MTTEEFKVSGEDVIAFIKNLIKDGNAHKISIKSEEGKILAEFPVTVGAVGLAIAPMFAAAGAIAALVSKCTIVVERR